MQGYPNPSHSPIDHETFHSPIPVTNLAWELNYDPIVTDDFDFANLDTYTPPLTSLPFPGVSSLLVELTKLSTDRLTAPFDDVEAIAFYEGFCFGSGPGHTRFNRGPSPSQATTSYGKRSGKVCWVFYVPHTLH